MMKKFLTALTVLALGFTLSQCTKDNEVNNCTNLPVTADEDSIEAYIAANGLENVQKDPETGLYYQIIEPGGASKPNVNSQIYIKYKGWLTDGTVFDQNSDPMQATWRLSTLIPAWQIGIPKIGREGKIKLLVPSALGYGCRGSTGAIPANAILIFDVELSDFD